MVEEVNSKMKKAFIVCIIALMLCFSMPSIVSEGVNKNFENDIIVVEPSSDSINILKDTATKYLNMDESMYEPTLNSEPYCEPQPLLGGNQIFGLWE